MARSHTPSIFVATTILVGIVALASIGTLAAQQATAPHLLERSQNPEPAEASPAKTAARSAAPCTLPADVSGDYAFEHENESIEIDIVREKNGCTLSGYITRLGDRDTDNNTPLTYNFSNATVSGSQLTFETKALHGTFYTFSGTIVRGRGPAREDAGYYVLTGKLKTQHAEHPQPLVTSTRVVRYQSLGRYAP